MTEPRLLLVVALAYAAMYAVALFPPRSRKEVDMPVADAEHRADVAAFYLQDAEDSLIAAVPWLAGTPAGQNLDGLIAAVRERRLRVEERGISDE